MGLFSHLKSVGLSDIGRKRGNNEDSFGVFPEAGVFCVADGMGGGDDGEVASAATVGAVEKFTMMHMPPPGVVYAASDYLDGLCYAVNSASAWICARTQEKHLKGCGSTFVGISFDPSKPAEAIALHAGDSRLYRIRSRSIQQITKDHSAAELIGAKDEGEINPMFRGMILRAVGIHPSVDIERTAVQVKSGDRFIICSDGLSRMVPDKKILATSRAAATPEEAAKALIAEANAAGGIDNVTVVVIDVGELPPPIPAVAMPKEMKERSTEVSTDVETQGTRVTGDTLNESAASFEMGAPSDPSTLAPIGDTVSGGTGTTVTVQEMKREALESERKARIRAIACLWTVLGLIVLGGAFYAWHVVASNDKAAKKAAEEERRRIESEANKKLQEEKAHLEEARKKMEEEKRQEEAERQKKQAEAKAAAEEAQRKAEEFARKQEELRKQYERMQAMQQNAANQEVEDAKAKAEAERIAKEAEEKAAAARAEAERVAREKAEAEKKAEAERAAKAEAERIAKEAEEKAAAAKAEAERVAREKAEAEKKAEAERIARQKEKEEHERKLAEMQRLLDEQAKAKEQAEAEAKRIAAAKAEADAAAAKAKAETERIAKEKAEAVAKAKAEAEAAAAAKAKAEAKAAAAKAKAEAEKEAAKARDVREEEALTALAVVCEERFNGFSREVLKRIPQSLPNGLFDKHKRFRDASKPLAERKQAAADFVRGLQSIAKALSEYLELETAEADEVLGNAFAQEDAKAKAKATLRKAGSLRSVAESLSGAKPDDDDAPAKAAAFLIAVSEYFK